MNPASTQTSTARPGDLDATVSQSETSSDRTAPPGGPGRARRDEDLRTLLNSVGLRTTTQRLSILRLLSEVSKEPGIGDCAHLTVPAIHDRLKELDGGHMDLSTIYRTVSTLAELGLLDAIPRVDRATAYGIATNTRHHALCRQCGAVQEISSNDMSGALQVIARSTGFRAREVLLTIHGVCSECRALAQSRRDAEAALIAVQEGREPAPAPRERLTD